MFRPSTPPRRKIALRFFLLPPVITLRAWPNTVRSRKAGAESATPTLARATLPDLIKNLRFILVSLESFGHLLSLEFRCTQNQPNYLCHWIINVRFNARTL